MEGSSAEDRGGVVLPATRPSRAPVCRTLCQSAGAKELVRTVGLSGEQLLPPAYRWGH